MILKKTFLGRNRRGFSLLELLMASALVPIVSFVIFSNIASGMRLWRALNQSVAEEDLCLFRQKTASDFNRLYKYSGMPFFGSPTEVGFAAPIDGPAELGGDLSIGRVGYSYDASKKILLKHVTNWSQYFKEVPGKSSVVLQKLRQFQIEYYYFDPQEQVFAWHEEWDASLKYMPAAVRFVCALEGRSEPLNFTFSIPCGN